MELVQDPISNKHTITAYETGKITIDKKSYTHSLILNDRTIVAWPPQNPNELTTEHITALIIQANSGDTPPIILLGVGPQYRLISPALLAPIYDKQFGLEVMDTAAACRTFNLLLSDGRAVLAALIV